MLAVLLAYVAQVGGQTVPTAGQIAFKGGRVATPARDAAGLASALDGLASSGARHAVVQLTGPINTAERAELTAAGVNLLRYVGDNAFFAAIEPAMTLAAMNQPGGPNDVVRCVLPIRREWKLHPDLANGNVPEWALVGSTANADPGGRGEYTIQNTEYRAVDEQGGASGSIRNPQSADNPQSSLGGTVKRSLAVLPSRRQPYSEPHGPAPQDRATRAAIVAVYVLFHADVDLDTEALAACQRRAGRVRSALRSINGLVIELPLDNLGALADEDAVQWIEPPLPPLGECNDDCRLRSEAQLVQQPPYDLDGAGVSVMVYDSGYGHSSHLDFGGRHHTRDTSGLSEHATHVAGTIGGDGSESGGTYRGMAPAVTIESYGYEQVGGLQPGFLYTDPGDLERDYDDAINVQGADIANNSIISNVALNDFPCHWEGNYGVTSALIDTIVRGDGGNPLFTQPFRVIWANGNERQVSTCLGAEGFPAPYHSTPPPACAKNHIAVGAVNSNDDTITSFSSFGPADDGRLKPDVVAPGCQTTDDLGVTSCSRLGGYRTRCGTSMACPVVCGLGALLLQDYRQQYPSQPDFRNSTLKTLLTHTAADLDEIGPDYKSGYGSVRAQAAVDLLRRGDFLESAVDQGGTYSAVVIVEPGDPLLKVTLAWDDVPATPNVTQALVNDLDLQVYDAANTHYYPWTLDPADPSAAAVRTQADHVNNIEQVVIDAPAPGAYRVEVVAYNVPSGPQPFSLCASPTLAKCSSAGTLALDRPKYACLSEAGARVVDCDLNAEPSLIETIQITISSDTEPAGEPVLLGETGPDSAVFVGSIPLDTTGAAGVLQVSPGDTVTALYVDADNGLGGLNVEITDQASVDCQPPVISNVAADPVKPRDATITFETDEPARVTVRYGLVCGDLTWSQSTTEFKTAHSIQLPGLTEDTTYYFVVDAVDQADNAATDDNGGDCYQFATPIIPVYFTELFESDHDLAGDSLRFTPNGSADFYGGCTYPISALPTDPTGGTVLALGDDAFVQINLTGGAKVALYGVEYTTLYVGSNGYVTFTAGDTEFSGELEDHFDLPRVSGLFADLAPTVGGTITRRILADRVAITYDNVLAHGGGTGNTFQIELFFDGQIALSYLDLQAAGGVIGLSAGAGLPADFFETDLSALVSCGPHPPVASGLSIETEHGLPVSIELSAEDDGLPDPPAQLTYIVASLPLHGVLSDPGGGEITAADLPYTLVAAGREITYAPHVYYGGPDSFTYKANDGGEPPEGGDSNAATVSLTIGLPVLIHSFSFDEDPGWTTEELWAFGTPTGGGSHNFDPTSGYTGTNVYGYNLDGDYTNSMDREYLTTTVMDCQDVTYTELRFHRWLGVESSNFDHAGIDATGDGAQWKNVWEHRGTDASETAWTLQTVDISSVADNQEAVQVRWAMGLTDGGNTFPGWNIDDVEIWGVVSLYLVGDINCDLAVDFGDINPFILALSQPDQYAQQFPDCPLKNRDINGDGYCDFGDINPYIDLLTGPAAGGGLRVED